MTPEEWEVATVEEVCSFRRGLTWTKAQERDTPGANRVPVLRIPNVKSRLDVSDLLFVEGLTADQVERARISKGWCVMVGSNGNPKRVGNCVLVEDVTDYLFGSFLVGVGPADPRRIDSGFLYRLLASERIQSDIGESVQGSTGLKNINLSRLKTLRVAVPPLGEQRKIATILSAVDDSIEATQAVIDQLQVVKKAMMAELLTRGLPGRHTKFKQTEIGEVPESWEVVPLEQLCSAIVDCPHSTPKYVESGFPVIRTADVIPGRMLLQGAKRVAEETLLERVRRLLPEAGDVFYSREGERFGIAAPVPPGVRLCLGQRMMHLRASSETDRSFLCWLMNAPVVYSQAVDGVGGSTSPHVNVRAVRGFAVPRPPKQEQIQIGGVLDVIERRVADEELVLDGCRHVKTALMSVLLTGEVRVTPDKDAA